MGGRAAPAPVIRTEAGFDRISTRTAGLSFGRPSRFVGGFQAGFA